MDDAEKVITNLFNIGDANAISDALEALGKDCQAAFAAISIAATFIKSYADPISKTNCKAIATATATTSSEANSSGDCKACYTRSEGGATSPGLKS